MLNKLENRAEGEGVKNLLHSVQAVCMQALRVFPGNYEDDTLNRRYKIH